MERYDGSPIVVIGASAGGIQALLEIVAQLPANFPMPVLVVVHIGRGRSILPRIIERAGVLTASHAEHGELIRPGHVYVAPPDVHMLVRSGHIVLNRGPRENHSRPAVDPLFRSAATAYGPATIGVILSGALNDGTTGLMMIKGHGGTVIVQDPEDAIVGGMPQNALRLVDADYVLSATEIGTHLANHQLMADSMSNRRRESMGESEDLRMIREDFREQEGNGRSGELTMFTCPDCGGSLWQSTGSTSPHFRCHVGHTWGAESLLGNKSEELEAALWMSVRLLEERATLSRQLAARLVASGEDARRSTDIEEQAKLDERRADAIRELLRSPLNLALQILEVPDTAIGTDD
jgi:two-component system chemotaxis response regulator CheB